MDEHISDDELSRYSYDPESFPSERQAEIQRHIAGCTECDAHFDFYTAFDEDLRDPAVWQPSDGAVPMIMRAYRLRCEAEDAEADRLLKPYLANPTMAAFADIRKLREFRTGGVVRRLNAQANAMAANRPLAALAFADLAQSIADLLPDRIYPREIVHELRGTAWKERANALLRIGKIAEALQSLQQAERSYRRLQSPSLGLASVDLVRAAAYYQQGELATAETHAERAHQAFAYLGQPVRGITALHLRASIKLEALQSEAAGKLYQQVIEYGEEMNDAQWIAKGSYGRGNSELDRGNLAEASMLFTKAFVILRETGPVADRISTEWGLARVVLHGGKPSEAILRLRDVNAAFEKLGMVTDAALVNLDIADALLVLGHGDQIAKIAEHSYRVLKRAGVVTGALSALAYMKEAAAQGRLTPEVIQGVRQFLHRVERDPELVFVPPPATPD